MTHIRTHISMPYMSLMSVVKYLCMKHIRTHISMPYMSLMSVVKVPMYEGYVRERGVCVFTCTRVHARMHMQACICT